MTFIIYFQLIAHELGHNLGMYHDFENDNKKYCGQSQGLMSYGFYQAPYRYWSTCSQHNFKGHYQNMVNQKWILVYVKAKVFKMVAR